MTKKLTEKEREVLAGLDFNEWRKPIEFGGRDGSHHSDTARQLVMRGLVEVSGYKRISRRVNWYRLTPSGLAALKLWRRTGRDIEQARGQ